jgi:cryptochrome
VHPLSTLRSRDIASRYLKFGCVSVRTMFRELQRVLAAHPKHTVPPVSLVGQLYWREYFYLAAHTTPNFDKMAGNPICRQIPWGRDAQVIQAWEQARTGFPWIDAIMTQLKQWSLRSRVVQ